MKKIVGIALITLGFASCTSTNYLPCPAYGSVEQEKEQFYSSLECENCDEIN